MTELSARLTQRQTQTLSPRLQQAVRLLQLSSLEFMQELQQMLGNNPFLESDEPEEGATAVLDVNPDADGPERDAWPAEGPGPRPGTDDAATHAMNLVAASSSLATHLHGQLNVLTLSDRDMALAKMLVESLDDDGYLRTDLAELVELAELDPPASEADLRIALRRVQALEPAGVGARTVSECLLLQVPDIADAAQRELARTIVTDHLDTLATKDAAAVAKAMGQPLAPVLAACERIRRFDPHPGWRFGGAHVQYITPDVIVRKVRGVWFAALNPAVLPKVRLNQVYADLFRRHRDGVDGELAGHLRDAQWAVRNVQQRFATILGVAQAILKRQGPFFEYGAMAMKPLGLREIADEVGVHESTVSRVTNNKYMATPHGVFELKYFFSRAMKATGGASFSGTAIRGLVAEMIEAEHPDRPLSDAEIARQLAQQGLVLARRTVTKYRQQLKVEPVEKRRRSPA